MNGLFTLPLFARAGAIIPQMFVDEQTMNAFGKRLDGSTRDELIVRVYADERPSQFTLYEDDGVTTAYQQGRVRTTVIAQQRSGNRVTVSIAPAVGTYDGAPAARNTVVQIAVRDATPIAVSVNGNNLARQADAAALDASESGWIIADGLIIAKSRATDVRTPNVFDVLIGPQ
jgi:hypothetical protein